MSTTALPRLLITGVDETLGANLAVALAPRFDVWGVPTRRLVELDGCRMAPCRSGQPGGLAEIVRQHRPDWVIHCGEGIVGSWDQRRPGRATARLVDTCRELAAAARQHGAFLTAVSSDALLAGPRLFHDETAGVGSSRAGAAAVHRLEQALHATAALIVRTHAYGWSPPGATPCWAEQLCEALAQRRPLVLDPQPHATPILIADLADLLAAAYAKRLTGLYHLAGAERTNRRRFAEELGALLGQRPCWSPGPARLARGPLAETGLDTRRARAELGRPMPLLRCGLERFVAQLRDGHRAALGGRTANRQAA